MNAVMTSLRIVPRAQPSVALTEQPRWQLAAAGLCVAGCFYTGLLAFLSARGLPVSSALLTIAELAILGTGALLLLAGGLREQDAGPLAFIWLSLFTAVVLSIANDRPFPDGARNFLIISVFTMLGLRLRLVTVDRCFALLSLVVLAFLVLEIVSTAGYVAVFQPAAYFSKARGVEEFSLDQSGLFRNALGYQGRFSLNIASHRTASIFIEQVSLANFASVIEIYLVSRWRTLGGWARALHLATVVLILLTNSSRTSSSLAFATLIGYWVYSRLSRYLNVVVPPLLLVTGVLVAITHPDAAGDNFAGRILHTMTELYRTDLAALFGGEVDKVGQFMDSGYPYVIYSTTIFGLLALWAYVTMFLPQKDAEQKRCAWATTLYIFVNMLIGGTAIFSMKVSAPLWLLAGALAAPAVRPVLDRR